MTKMKEILSTDKQINTVLFDCSCHPKMLMVGLNSLRDKHELLDITFIAEKQAFRAHKVVLAACSDYFRAMFTGNMLEARQNEIILSGVTAEGFQILLDYAYTSLLPLNLANVQNVLAAASHLQMLEVVHTCSNYLQSQIDIDNCVDLATIAEIYSLSQLKIKAYKFMSSHLMEFSRTSEFYRLSPQQLENLLTYEFPVDCSEEDVLRIVLKWFAHLESSDVNVCQRYGMRLLQHIHFTEILPQKIESVLERTLSVNQKNDQYLYKLVLTESTRQCSGGLKAQCNTVNLLNSRGMEMALLKIGGFGVSGVTNEITYRLSSSQKWRHLTSIPHVEQCNFGSVVHNNELYIVGGCFNQSLQENVHPFGFKYTPLCNKWHTITPMTTERCRFSLNVVGSKLYAIGGASEMDDDLLDLTSTDTCEVYDPANDTWENIAALPEVRTQHAAATYENGPVKYLFVSGGIYRDTAVATMYVYNIDQNTWHKCKPMLTPRADHVMLTINNHLYVCGGWRDDNLTRRRTHNCTIDKYNVMSGTWDTVTRIPTPRFHAGIVSIGKKIYLIGGFHSESMFDRDRAAIECYDIVTDTWTSMGKYPQDIWEHACATLYIPKCRDDMEVLAGADNSS